MAGGLVGQRGARGRAGPPSRQPPQRVRPAEPSKRQSEESWLLGRLYEQLTQPEKHLAIPAEMLPEKCLGDANQEAEAALAM